MSQALQAKKTITIQVEVGEPEEVATGVFRTSLKHPALDGTLTLVHNTNGREVMLENLSSGENEVDVVEAVGKIIKVAKDSGLFKGLGSKQSK